MLLDDGKIRLTAIEVSPQRALTRVEVGGKLSARKGVSLPDTVLGFSALTGKDHSDLEAALDAGADWIALSFIQRPDDIAEAKKIARGRAAVMAKMEKPQAIEHLAGILDITDALMVARGDLGVELPVEKVPGLQKQMTRASRRAGKPVVIATQMLESMITSPVPTRAEVSDVATAIFEGADAVMLSAESAAGQYPVEAVATMDRIAIEVEGDPTYRGIMDAQRAAPEATGADAIAAAAREIAETLDLTAFVCWTSSGATALRVARERPKSPIVSITPNIATGRKLAAGVGRPQRRSPRMPTTRTTWSTAPAASPSRTASPRPASASSSSPACRSAPRARPTWCASPWSARRPRGRIEAEKRRVQ